MRNFEYFAPTKVVFGEGAEERAGELVKEFGGTKVLVHFGGQSAKRSGVLDRVVSSLDAAGVEHVLFGGVEPNPHISLVRDGIKVAKEAGVDFLLAVGGGSVIDSAKAIGYGLADPEGGDPWDFYEGTRKPSACMPIGVVLTVAAAGSEMSNSSVLTEGKTGKKRGVHSDTCRPRFALMNPALTLTVADSQTAAGSVDILMHVLERYFDTGRNNPLIDGLAESLMRGIMINARRLKKNPDNLQARSEMMWAGSLAHNGLMGDGGDWSCHQLEHELSGMFNVAHGAGLAAIWGTWARYVAAENPKRFERLALKVLGLDYDPEDGVALAASAIEAMEDFFKELGLPTTIRGLGINPSENQIKALARSCSFGGTRTIGSYKVLSEEDMAAIYTKALGK